MKLNKIQPAPASLRRAFGISLPGQLLHKTEGLPAYKRTHFWQHVRVERSFGGFNPVTLIPQ